MGADLASIGVQDLGITTEKGKIKTDEFDQTSLEGVYAIGDTALGAPELTPAAILAGKNLAKRLFSSYKKATDYVNFPTTVFTPLEYSSCGYHEKQAEEKFGEDKVPQRNINKCFVKMITLSESGQIIGFHYVGP